MKVIMANGGTTSAVARASGPGNALPPTSACYETESLGSAFSHLVTLDLNAAASNWIT